MYYQVTTVDLFGVNILKNNCDQATTKYILTYSINEGKLYKEYVCVRQLEHSFLLNFLLFMSTSVIISNLIFPIYTFNLLVITGDFDGTNSISRTLANEI